MARNIDYDAVARGRDKALRTGALVNIKPEFEARSRYTRPGAVLVVIADKFDLCNVMEVGGGNDHRGTWQANAYARIPSTWLQVIDPASAFAPEFLKAAKLKVYDHPSAASATLTEVPVPGAGN